MPRICRRISIDYIKIAIFIVLIMFVIGLVGTSVLVNNGTLKGDSGIWNLTNGLWINAALIGVNLAFAATSFYAARKQDERLNEIHYATMRNAYHGNYSKEMNEKFNENGTLG